MTIRREMKNDDEFVKKKKNQRWNEEIIHFANLEKKNISKKKDEG